MKEEEEEDEGEEQVEEEDQGEEKTEAMLLDESESEVEEEDDPTDKRALPNMGHDKADEATNTVEQEPDVNPEQEPGDFQPVSSEDLLMLSMATN